MSMSPDKSEFESGLRKAELAPMTVVVRELPPSLKRIRLNKNSLTQRGNEWINDRRPTWSMRTLDIAVESITKFAAFVEDRPISAALLDDYIRFLKSKYAKATVRLRWDFVSSFLKWCYSKQYIEKRIDLDKTEKVSSKKVYKREFYTKKEYEILKVRAAGHWMYYAIVMGYNTGLRLSDVAMVKWEDVDMEKQTITVTPKKTKRNNIVVTIPFLSDGDIMTMLREMRKQSGSSPYVCPPMAAKVSEERGTVVLGIYSRMWFKTHGIPGKQFHTFRRTFLTNMMSSGVESIVAMNITGITSLDILKHYVVPNDRMLLKAIVRATEYRDQET